MDDEIRDERCNVYDMTEEPVTQIYHCLMDAVRSKLPLPKKEIPLL